MKVSLNWVKQYLDFELPPIDELVERIGAQLGAVEEVEDLGARYKGVVIARVVECEALADSDHLQRCLIDDAGKVQGVERNAQGLVQVLTGAPNVHTDMLAVWLAPGVTVPESVGKDPFVLTSRDMRGSISHGMLASARELALGDNHEGLLDLAGEVTRNGQPLEPGADFAEALGLHDYIIDIENKMFTHRPDCFGMLGVAREIAGILGQQFTSPNWYLQVQQDVLNIDGTPLPLEVHNELPGLVPRFVAIALGNVTVKPSPLWLQTYLLRCGVRPISNVVDVTNYIMLLTGQPMHAYDYDKVKAFSEGGKVAIMARYPRSGETIKLLNGKTIEPRSEALMVATERHLLCVGGSMGGVESEVDETTKNVILEAATWDMYSIRRTSMAHGIFTDAVTRFNKGQSPLQNDEVAAKAVAVLRDLTGAQVAGPLIDNNHVDEQGRERHSVHPPVPVTTTFINTRLGLELSGADMKRLLENVECEVGVDGDRLTVTAPFWRTDIELREDVVEEVGRLYGYDRLPLELPRRSITPAIKNTTLELKDAVRNTLAKAGANELLTYSFVHGDLLRKVGQNPAEAFELGNALSPELQYYRLSITPSLLDKVHMNIKAGHEEFALFEIGKTHGRSQLDSEGLPREFERLAFVYAAAGKRAVEAKGAPYYVARKYLVNLLEAFGVWQKCTLILASQAGWEGHPFFSEVVRPFDPARSAVIYDGERILGVIGEYSATTRRALKLPGRSAGFEFGLNLIPQQSGDRHYRALSRFPTVWQDTTLKVAADQPYAEMHDLVAKQLAANAPDNTQTQLENLGIYQATDDASHKNITFRIHITGYNRTLTDKEVTSVVEAIAIAARAELGAEQV